MALTQASDTGNSQTDGITSVTAPVLTVTLDPSVQVGDTVELQLDGSSLAHPVTHTITSDDLSAGSVSLSVTDGDLGADGDKVLTAKFTDIAGNSTTSDPNTITLVTPPSGGAPALTEASDTGNSQTDGITSVTAPVFTVTLDPSVQVGDTVELQLDGSTLTNPVTHTITSDDLTAGSVSLSVTDGDLGADGDKVLTAKFTDTYGFSTTSAPKTITLDTTAPSGGAPALTQASDTGISQTDGITSMTAPVFTVTLDPSVQVGDTVELQLGSSSLTHPVTHIISSHDLDVGSVNLSVTNGDLGADDHKVLTAKFTDSAGNTTNSATTTIILDTMPPSVGNVSIASNNDDHTRAKAGDTLNWTFSTDDAQGGASVTFNGHTITAESTDNNHFTATYTLNGSDTAGAANFTIRATDLAGNIGIASQTDLSLGTDITIERVA